MQLRSGRVLLGREELFTLRDVNGHIVREANEPESIHDFVKGIIGACVVSDVGDKSYVLLEPGKDYSVSLVLLRGTTTLKRDVKVTCDMSVNELNDLVRSTLGRGCRVNRAALLPPRIVWDFGPRTIGKFKIFPGVDVAVNEGETFEIFVRDLFQHTSTLNDVVGTDEIIYVKHLLKLAIDIDVQQQRLIFAGKELDDRGTLDDYNIRPESTLLLVLRMRGDVGEWVVPEDDGKVPRPTPEERKEKDDSHTPFAITRSAVDEATRVRIVREIQRRESEEDAISLDRKYSVPVDCIGTDLY